MEKLAVAFGVVTLMLSPLRVGVDAPHLGGRTHVEKKDVAHDSLEILEQKVLATLVQTHTRELVMLTKDGPESSRFSELLTDRVTGEHIDLDSRLLGLLRALTAKYAGARIELVSGYRSAKLNEMMRKKGHHVASHSQHSLGHAVDFRIVPAGELLGVDPRVLEADIRALGWDGGVGTYLTKDDWFVHADVGAHRAWRE